MKSRSAGVNSSSLQDRESSSNSRVFTWSHRWVAVVGEDPPRPEGGGGPVRRCGSVAARRSVKGRRFATRPGWEPQIRGSKDALTEVELALVGSDLGAA